MSLFFNGNVKEVRAGSLLIAGASVLLGPLVVVVYFPAPSPPILDPSPVKEIRPHSPSVGSSKEDNRKPSSEIMFDIN